MVEFTLNLEDRYKIWSNRIQYLRSENERVRDRTRGEKEKARNRKEVGEIISMPFYSINIHW